MIQELLTTAIDAIQSVQSQMTLMVGKVTTLTNNANAKHTQFENSIGTIEQNVSTLATQNQSGTGNSAYRLLKGNANIMYDTGADVWKVTVDGVNVLNIDNDGVNFKARRLMNVADAQSTGDAVSRSFGDNRYYKKETWESNPGIALGNDGTGSSNFDGITFDDGNNASDSSFIFYEDSSKVFEISKSGKYVKFNGNKLGLAGIPSTINAVYSVQNPPSISIPLSDKLQTIYTVPSGVTKLHIHGGADLRVSATPYDAGNHYFLAFISIRHLHVTGTTDSLSFNSMSSITGVRTPSLNHNFLNVVAGDKIQVMYAASVQGGDTISVTLEGKVHITITPHYG